MDHLGSVYRAGETLTASQASSSTIKDLDRPSRIALLVAMLAEECDQWALVDATSIVLGGPVDLDVLDQLVARSLVTVESGQVRILQDEVRRAVAAGALPSQRQAVHLALAAILRGDPLAAAWHKTFSTQAPDTAAAAVALTTARMLQGVGRPAHAREMLKHAARLSMTEAA